MLAAKLTCYHSAECCHARRDLADATIGLQSLSLSPSQKAPRDRRGCPRVAFSSLRVSKLNVCEWCSPRYCDIIMTVQEGSRLVRRSVSKAGQRFDLTVSYRNAQKPSATSSTAAAACSLLLSKHHLQAILILLPTLPTAAGLRDTEAALSSINLSTMQPLGPVIRLNTCALHSLANEDYHTI